MDIKRVEITERAVTSSSREAIFWPELDGLHAVACGLVVVAILGSGTTVLRS
jgi:hypothetical protein